MDSDPADKKPNRCLDSVSGLIPVQKSGMKTAKANIKRVKISDLKAHPKNAKNHDKDGIRQSIREYGYAETITVDENGVILAGHGRVEQLSAEGYTEVDAFVKEGLTEKQKEEYILKANKLVERGGWDKEKLKLFDEDVLENALFSSSEIDKIFAGTEDDEDPFNVDEEYKAIKKPTVKIGEIYQLGNHRLMCGSATSEDDMKKLMGDDKADCIFSDPPYNMNYKSHKHGGIIGDNQGVEEFETFSLKFIQLMDVHARPGATFYICSGYNSYPVFLYALVENGFHFATPIVWVKNTIGMGLQDYRPKHELVIKTRRVKKNKKAEMVLYGWKQGKRYFTESRSEADVWEFKKLPERQWCIRLRSPSH